MQGYRNSLFVLRMGRAKSGQFRYWKRGTTLTVIATLAAHATLVANTCVDANASPIKKISAGCPMFGATVETWCWPYTWKSSSHVPSASSCCTATYSFTRSRNPSNWLIKMASMGQSTRSLVYAAKLTISYASHHLRSVSNNLSAF